jgi:hypothetical protein
MTLGLTRSLTLTPFGPNKSRTASTLMGTGGTPSPPGADTSAMHGAQASSRHASRGGDC